MGMHARSNGPYLSPISGGESRRLRAKRCVNPRFRTVRVWGLSRTLEGRADRHVLLVGVFGHGTVRGVAAKVEARIAPNDCPARPQRAVPIQQAAAASSWQTLMEPK